MTEKEDEKPKSLADIELFPTQTKETKEETESVEEIAEETHELPPRGTGLATGNAGERRQGTPHTEEERAERHARKTRE